MSHMEYSDVHEDCCPSHSQSSGKALSVLEIIKDTSEKEQVHLEKFPQAINTSGYNGTYALEFSFRTKEHPDKQSFFFVDTIRLLI